MDSKLCQQCGAEFTPSKGYPQKRFCGKRCAGKYSGAIPRPASFRIYTCPECKVEYRPSNKGQIHCSRKCNSAAIAKKIYPLVSEIVPLGYKRCRSCLELHPANKENFYAQATTSDGFQAYCRGCQDEKNAAYRQNNPVAAKRYKQKADQRTRLEVMTHYCDGPPQCACCGETVLVFLTLHHIGGGGTTHRQSGVGGGVNFCRWLRKNGYPDGYAVLCWNCNMADGMYGCCPHIGTPTSGIRQKRVTVLQGYGGLVPSCVCCGVTGLEFLAIDHVNGDGAYQRREVHPWEALNFYHWLIKHDFPPGFRILCHSCNSARAFYGCCPHEEQHP